MSLENEIPTQGSALARVLSLPYELLQSVFNSIAAFEPWTDTPILDRGSADIADKELMHIKDTMMLNTIPINRHVLGISSDGEWLMMVLSRHPYHLSRRDGFALSSVVMQALRRMNVRLQKMHSDARALETGVLAFKTPARALEESPISVDEKDIAAKDKTRNTISDTPSMTQYHASVQSEEKSHFMEHSIKSSRTSRATGNTSLSSTALTTYNPAPVLKLSNQDLLQITRQQDIQTTTHHLCALLLATLLTLAQCRLDLTTTLEKLERDTPIPSIEPSETRAFATPDNSPPPDRTRSLSGSTVADPFPFHQPLSFSAISTVCDLGTREEVRWAEKRGTECEGAGTPPKRPKLAGYRKVSNGRVAALMDRFERFHLEVGTRDSIIRRCWLLGRAAAGVERGSAADAVRRRCRDAVYTFLKRFLQVVGTTMNGCDPKYAPGIVGTTSTTQEVRSRPNPVYSQPIRHFLLSLDGSLGKLSRDTKAWARTPGSALGVTTAR
ncbi:hypothetical protein C7974DRAFT_468090 [Boeremia exigua]|uniref:uncharacterized protein n=1 Tax=Boeremia exigua TaxID=749465 RepID=UPI001E8D373F|nr:uncharacterized protein C7974DRAFT_468090 [Boeremia exigua]KAH6644468.1 hypothetical protein C7974DRAFT_468090 [Boeremia exigua]